MPSDTPTSEEGRPFTLHRRRANGQTDWEVRNAEGEAVGHVFRYIGYWWAGSAGSLRNRAGSKEQAAQMLWDTRAEVPSSDEGQGGVDA